MSGAVIFARVALLILFLQVSFLHPTFTWTPPLFLYGVLEPAVQREVRNVSTKQTYASFSQYGATPYNSITFVGDILLARNVEYLMQKHGDNYPFAGFDFSRTSYNSAVFGNFEAAIPRTHIPTPAKQLTFSVATSAIPILKQNGVTHVSLANNHTYDFKADGFEHTVAILESNAITTLGRPTSAGHESVGYVKINEETVAVIALQGIGMSSASSDWLRLITQASRRSHIQIVFIHWGEEYALRHSPAQEQLATELIAAGVDLIVGHHPHVVEDVGLIDGVPVFYSIGNYIFDQYFSKDVQEGLVLHIYQDNGWYVHLLPVTSQESISQPRLMNEIAHRKFLRSLARKSHDDIRSDVETGRLALHNLAVATSSKTAMIEQ